MKALSNSIRGSKSSEEERSTGRFLRRVSFEERHQCKQPSFTPWSDEEDKFGEGSIWQCGGCGQCWISTGTEPVVFGFWRPISQRRARKLAARVGRPSGEMVFHGGR